jgi:hypothetical protein
MPVYVKDGEGGHRILQIGFDDIRFLLQGE